MSLSDFFKGEASTLLTEAGLLIFVGVFAAIVWRLVFRMPRSEARAMARMALDDEPASGAAESGGAR